MAFWVNKGIISLYFYLLKNSCSQVVECASHIHPSQILQTSNFACNRLFFCSSAQQQQQQQRQQQNRN